MRTDTFIAEPLLAEFAPSAGQAGLDRLLSALQRHYAELVAHVRRHIGVRGGDKTVAGDIVHEVCVELLERPPAAEIRVPLAFLREVTVRRAIDHYRLEHGRRAWVESVDELPEVADGSAHGRDPALRVADRQWLMHLVRAIESLPPRCRDVFVMHKIHEFSQPAVAEHLGISPKTVEKHVRLGMAACREALAAAGVLPQ